MRDQAKKQTHQDTRNDTTQYLSTVKHRNTGKIRRRQTIRYLDASSFFVLLISII